MAKRKPPKRRRKPETETETYTDPEGNSLQLRKALSAASLRKIAEPPSSDAASIEDAYQRREEMQFERLAVSWEIAGMPITDQKLLLGRYRMASNTERRWVRATIAEHLRTWFGDL